MKLPNLAKGIIASLAINTASSCYSPDNGLPVIQDVRQDQTRVATVTKNIHFGQKGRASYAGTEWFAATSHRSIFFSPGDQVYVVGRQEGTNTLVVEPYKHT